MVTSRNKGLTCFSLDNMSSTNKFTQTVQSKINQHVMDHGQGEYAVFISKQGRFIYTAHVNTKHCKVLCKRTLQATIILQQKFILK